MTVVKVEQSRVMFPQRAMVSEPIRRETYPLDCAGSNGGKTMKTATDHMCHRREISLLALAMLGSLVFAAEPSRRVTGVM